MPLMDTQGIFRRVWSSFADTINNLEWGLETGSNYGLSMPPHVGSVTSGGNPVPVIPASGESAGQTIQDISNQQIRDWQAQNQASFEALNAKNNPADMGMSWWEVGLIGIGIVGAIVMLGDSGPRRYGR